MRVTNIHSKSICFYKKEEKELSLYIAISTLLKLIQNHKKILNAGYPMNISTFSQVACIGPKPIDKNFYDRIQPCLYNLSCRKA